MKYENGKFYISKQELENLDKIISMWFSPDIEQKLLARTLYNQMALDQFIVHGDPESNKVSDILVLLPYNSLLNSIQIDRKKFIIT